MAMKEPENYILSIDQGTTGTRAIIFDHNGRKVIEAGKALPQYYPHPGWVEQDANEIWNTVLSVIASAMIDGGVHPEYIKGIGISNQRETTVIWDRETGNPIYHAIGWQSKQTAKIAKKLIEDGYQDLVHERTGLVIDSYFSATKIRWILDHVAGAQERAERGELCFGTIDSWLIWRLSGGKLHVTDYTNASRTMLFNITDLTWDSEMLKLLNIPESMLPEVRSSSEIYGTTENYEFYGEQVPIAGVAGDQQAALIGQMAFKPGMIKNTYGDGAFIVMNTGDKPQFSENNLLTTIAYDINGKLKYALEGSIFVAGSAISWLADELKIIDNVPQSRQVAMKSENNDEVYVVPAFNGLGAPYWDQDAQGAVFGLTRGSSREDFVKATLQSVAYQTRDIIETMEKDTGMKIPEILADGGASRNRYLMQFQADILAIDIKRAADEDTSAMGAAFLAGLAIGFWDDLDEITKIHETGRLFEPKMEKDRRNRLYKGWQNAVAATRMFKA